jgi:hypothetical protein
MSNVKKGSMLEGGHSSTREMWSGFICGISFCGLSVIRFLCVLDLRLSAGKLWWDVVAPPLMYRKWGFTEQDRVVHSEVVGPATGNTFDHVVTTSLYGCFSARDCSSAPQMSLILATGKNPYAGFHYALEGAAPPVFADVTNAVVSKLKSAFDRISS